VLESWHLAVFLTEDEKGKKLASESVFHYVLKLDGLGEARMFYREYFLT